MAGNIPTPPKTGRTAFPPVFWLANFIEVLERFAYYGIYFSFGIYMSSLGFSRGDLGVVQLIFIFISYVVPIFSGTFADRFGFKKVLMVAYLAYLPSILLLILTKSFSGIALTMLCIGFAAGIFKPLIAGTVRAVTNSSNKTMGFGIFYAMVNIGGSLGPIAAGRMRAISWDYAFYMAAATIGFMFLVTVFFYKEPPRETEGATLKQKMADIWVALSDLKFSFFLLLLGVFFWIPFWAFFNLCALYVETDLDTARLYFNVSAVLGTWLTQNVFAHQDDTGTWRVLGETLSHTGWIIIIFQVFISRISEKFKAMPSFLFGLFVAAIGFCIMGYSHIAAPAFVFLGIFFFAVGEMISSPRIQEYITWLAPKEKAGLYMGANFLAVAIGAFSGPIYTPLSGYFRDMGHADYVWYVLAAHLILAIIALHLFVKFAGEFKEQEE
jgi:POT family proton-dependent oligopeptide transporter